MCMRDPTQNMKKRRDMYRVGDDIKIYITFISTDHFSIEFRDRDVVPGVYIDRQ